MDEKISVSLEVLPKELRQLAAIAYGESSPEDNESEMFAIASVMVKQRDARGYKDIPTFVNQDATFSYVVRDGNKRYKKYMNTSEKAIAAHPGMMTALAAARNALQGGEDRSNGAYFWDGLDIKLNYKGHFKVHRGIKFSDPSHNIYDLKESTEIRVKTLRIKKRDRKTGNITVVDKEVARSDHTYDSTTAHGGAIFWKVNPDFLKAVGGKEYR